jgi:hypothetical protein
MLKIYMSVYFKPHLLWFLIYVKDLVLGVLNMEIDFYVEVLL